MSREGEKGNNSLLQRYSQNNHCTIIKRSNSSHLLVFWRSKSASQSWQTIGRRQLPKATNVLPLPPLRKNSTHPTAFICDSKTKTICNSSTTLPACPLHLQWLDRRIHQIGASTLVPSFLQNRARRRRDANDIITYTPLPPGHSISRSTSHPRQT